MKRKLTNTRGEKNFQLFEVKHPNTVTYNNSYMNSHRYKPDRYDEGVLDSNRLSATRRPPSFPEGLRRKNNKEMSPEGSKVQKGAVVAVSQENPVHQA
jgi:hypothetical protein